MLWAVLLRPGLPCGPSIAKPAEERFAVPLFPALNQGFKCEGGGGVRRYHEAVGKIVVDVPANDAVHLKATFGLVVISSCVRVARTNLSAT